MLLLAASAAQARLNGLIIIGAFCKTPKLVEFPYEL